MSWGGGDSERMDVPNSYIGKIIGRGGSRIRELQEESGARINVAGGLLRELRASVRRASGGR